MSGPSPDPWLDEQLRNVPLPEGLVARLTALGEGDDALLDAALRDVPLPDGLSGRLLQIPVVVPRYRWARRAALAASLVAALGLGVWLRGGWNARQADRGLADRPVSVAGPDAAPDAVDSRALAVEPLETALPELELPDLPQPGGDWNGPPADRAPAVTVAAPRTPQPAAIFAADAAHDRLPGLERLARRAPRGMAVPRARGYDLRFQIAHGDHPFVWPASERSLQSILVPLSASRRSYDRTWQALLAGRLSAPDEVRVEDFLAAMNYDFPAPQSGAVALRTAAGPSPLAEPELSMLQVAVQARPWTADHPPVHLVVAVDVSSSMAQPGRLDVARAALDRLLSRLSPRDRLSLMAFNDRVDVPARSLSIDRRSELQGAVAALAAGGATNFGGAVAAAVQLAQAESPGLAARLAILTDGLSSLDLESAAAIESLLAAAGRAGCGVRIVQLGPDLQAEALLSRFAQSAQGKATSSDDAQVVERSLAELLSGRSLAVADRTTLKVSFNPRSVAAYRLLGHATSDLTGPLAPDREVTLRAGETASGLFEIRLLPEGGDDVATAELAWTDAASGKPARAVQRISRLQFAKSFAESAPSLQAAALAAETAETLAGSYYAAAPQPLVRVLELSAEVHPRLAAEVEFQRFVALVRQAQRLRSQPATQSPRLP